MRKDEDTVFGTRGKCSSYANMSHQYYSPDGGRERGSDRGLKGAKVKGAGKGRNSSSSSRSNDNNNNNSTAGVGKYASNDRFEDIIDTSCLNSWLGGNIALRPQDGARFAWASTSIAIPTAPLYTHSQTCGGSSFLREPGRGPLKHAKMILRPQ